MRIAWRPAAKRDARAPRRQTFVSAAIMQLPEKPLHGAPCNALQRFLKRGLGQPKFPLAIGADMRTMRRHEHRQ